MNLNNLKYPIGNFEAPKKINLEVLENWKNDIAEFPDKIKTKVAALEEENLSWIYRPDGWSIQQVIHHCADSHMNAFIRFKLSLTEERPTIKPYKQSSWSSHEDYQAPISASLSILSGVHERWSRLLNSMEKDEFRRTFYHPEMELEFRLDVALSLYSWHSRHHAAHIDQAIKYQGNF